METDENKNTENIDNEQNEEQDDLNFIQEFIDRKKLENSILQKIIEHIKQAENQDKSPNK